METAEKVRVYGFTATFLAILAYCWFAEASRAPLSAEAAQRALIAEKSRATLTEQAPRVFIGSAELAPEKVESIVKRESVFGIELACIDAGVENTVHGALKLLSNEIGKEKIPPKYIELDKSKKVSPESIKLAWLNYWARTAEGETICIAR